MFWRRFRPTNFPQLQVFNKIDLLGMQPRIDRDKDGRPYRVWLSAQQGKGLDLLEEAIAELLGDDLVHEFLPIPHHQGRLRARLYEMGIVQSEGYNEDGVPVLEVRTPKLKLQRLVLQEGGTLPWEPSDREV